MSSELAKQLLWLAGLRSETDDKETLEMIDSVTFSLRYPDEYGAALANHEEGL